MTAVGADLKRAFEPWTDDSLKRWSPLSFPTGDGGTWTWAEPDARVRAHGGRLEIRVERFTRSHDVVQIFDNPKHLLGCKDVLAIPDHGIEIETSLGGETLRAPDDTWDTGFASFNLMDFEHGLVLDGLANGRRTAILFERLHIPGVIPEEQAWTAIADGPRSTRPGMLHDYRFLYEPREQRVRGWIDDVPVLDFRGVPFRINAFTPGVGLITLAKFRDGKSRSLRGQGGVGTFGPVYAARPGRSTA